MSCEICQTSPKGQQIELSVVIGQAKQYAIANEKTMAIFKEGTEFKYTSAEYAISAGLPIVQIVSHLQ